jgi:glycosyltransferase involved in cell wall biosynthesis
LIISLCILAKNEASTIGEMLLQLSRQSLVARRAAPVHLHVVANGCTDATVMVARDCAGLFEGTCVQLFVHDLRQGGKSRAWNTAVHEIAHSETKTFVFLDADVSLLSTSVIEDLVLELESCSSLPVCGGFPVKDVQAKQRKTYLDKFTLAVSARAKPVGVINGSLYAMRAEVAREIWLPNDVPGEDGFLNAMVTTRGFTTGVGRHVVKTAKHPTHSFKAHSASQFLAHERRMIVGTVINRWIFEYLWSLGLKEPAGQLIRRWNEEDPDWVEKIISRRSQGKLWVIPAQVTFGRLSAPKKSWLREIVALPLAGLATLLTIPPAIAANRKLKRRGATQLW